MTSAPLGYQLRTAAKTGQFLITAEVMPPKGGDPQHMLAMGQRLKGRVHAVNVTDGSRAVMRMSSWAAAVLLQQMVQVIQAQQVQLILAAVLVHLVI